MLPHFNLYEAVLPLNIDIPDFVYKEVGTFHFEHANQVIQFQSYSNGQYFMCPLSDIFMLPARSSMANSSLNSRYGIVNYSLLARIHVIMND